MFTVEGCRVVKLGADDVPALQALHEQCSAFLELVYGEPPEPDAAARFLEELPEGKTLEDKFVLGAYEEGVDGLSGVVEVIRDFPERGEWFVGFFMFNPARRNAGLGTRLHRGLEQWVRGQGATGLRLIVQEQNPGAVRFWQRQGYVITDTANQRAYGREMVLYRMRKPLAGGPA